MLETSLCRHSVYCHFIVGTTKLAEQAPPLLPPSPPLSLSVITEEFQTEIIADVAVVKGLQELENSFYSMLVRVMRYLQLKCDLSDAQLFLDTFMKTSAAATTFANS